MILVVDVDYRGERAFVAGVGLNGWTDSIQAYIYTTTVTGIEAYLPGQFFRRELPCILKLLQQHSLSPEQIVVDGYVYLGGEQQPGLGQHLYDALGAKVKVIGVAKESFKNTPAYCEVYRGKSNKPLYVTAAGIDLEQAKECIASMYGRFRVPALLKKADQVCRNWED